MPISTPPLKLSPPSQRWVYPPSPDPALVEGLRQDLNLPLPFCRLLATRGYAESERAKLFLRPKMDHIHPPLLMAGMEQAVERLVRAIRDGETILAHGDYDVDGICSTALYVRALRMMGGRAEPFVPHRLRDGYDLSEAGIRAAVAVGAKLILTGDCGIVAHDAIARAREAGIDVIVTDHHTPGPTLPDAAAVVNPNRRDCPYPDKGLAGVGVAYKLCCALAEAIGFATDRLTGLLDLVAVATVADLAPLTSENRALVRWGLKVLVQTRNPGLRALLRTTRLDRESEVTAGQVGYVLAPRINAIGRMGDARLGVELLLSENPAEAERIAEQLEEQNRTRREVDSRTLREAIRMLEERYDPDSDFGVVLSSESWHPGVIGIVASRVVELIHRPTVLIAVGEEEGKGSARSIPGFHLYEAIRDCSDHLLRFGGHRAAAGCSLRPERIDDFRDAFNARARAALTDDLLVPKLRIDVEIGLEEATEQLCRLLRHAAPFGTANPTPVFAARMLSVVGEPRIVGENHLKLTLAGGDARLEAIGFSMGDRLGEVTALRGPLEAAFRLEADVWNGRSRVQARLLDLRPAR